MPFLDLGAALALLVRLLLEEALQIVRAMRRAKLSSTSESESSSNTDTGSGGGGGRGESEQEDDTTGVIVQVLIPAIVRNDAWDLR